MEPSTQGGTQPLAVPGPDPSWPGSSGIALWGPRLLLIAAAFVLLFARLGERGLLETSEARYAETAREMLLSGDWITPRYFGVKHFHKPPLTYWITAAGYSLIGVNELGARLFLAVAGLAILILVWYLGRLWWDEATGLLAAAILLTSPLFTAFARLLTTDLYLTLATAAAIAGFATGHTGRRPGYLVMWAAMGAGFLLKGPVAPILVLLSIIPFLAVRRELARWREMYPFRGFALMLAIAAPWFVAVCLRNPGLFTQLVYFETWQRVTTTVHGRPGPWYYFIGVFLAGFFPWVLFVPATVRGLLDAPRHDRPGAEALCAAWFALPFLMFSASKSKLIAYILPLLPAAALLVARWCMRALKQPPPRVATFPVAAGSALSMAGVAFALHVVQPAAVEAIELHLMAFYPALAFLLLCAHRAERAQRARPLLMGAFVLAAVFPALVAPFADEMEGDFKSFRPLAMAIRESAPATAPVVLCRLAATSVPFYLGRPVHTFEAGLDLKYETDRSRQEEWHTDDMARLLKLLEERPAFVVADDETRLRIDRARWPARRERLRILARFRRHLLLTNQPPAASAQQVR
ncbi:MAG: glycosyltransferase family 39 protein [Candidatus Wallbacteria bacterium]|nr:glycosyltransferase family 39 protein [Candidatus Wallbacteria bacterium]